ncbi:helix-turn-helix domain-containing protein [Bosea sp. BIWAKO-01]|uniref:AraC family transcriptional regulator n=1 Tax=Bosea sp. BIWAKO-01 TaxID=506668 RepID=UPI0008535DEF|nr:helix-turn-helix transcriptional regulator [Bosea sp. BIWAKO-01]
MLHQSFASGARTRWHSHRRTELLHASGGLLVLSTETGTWTVPSGYALLVPADIPHELAGFGCCEMRAAFFTDEALGPALPAECRVIAVSDLLDVAMKSLATGPLLYDVAGRGGHLAALVVDEIAKAPEIHIALPMPHAMRLRKLCRDMIQKPSLDLDLDGWAQHVGVSRSTFTRQFRSETGLSFAEWRRRLRMLHTLTLQADGVPLRQAARTAGYRSANALRDMMRRTMSETMRPS